MGVFHLEVLLVTVALCGLYKLLVVCDVRGARNDVWDLMDVLKRATWDGRCLSVNLYSAFPLAFKVLMDV